MTIGLILKRILVEWRVLTILLLALAMVTGFFALGPLYIRSVNEVDLRRALNEAEEQELLVTVQAEEPLDTEAQALLQDEMGDLLVGVDRYKRGDYSAVAVSGAQGNPGEAGNAICTYYFTYGQNPLQNQPSFNTCVQAFAFEEPEKYIEVVEGRLPVRAPTPEQLGATVIDTAGLSLEEQQARQVGIYSRGEIEAIVTTTVAEEGGIEVGSRFLVGNASFNPASNQFTLMKVVGVVEVKDSDDLFWQSNRMFVQGADIVINPFTGQTRYEWGFAVHPDAYEDWIVPILPDNVDTQYIWRMQSNPDVINGNNAQEYYSAINSLNNVLGNEYASGQINTDIDNLIQDFAQRVDDAEGPIVFLSGAILILMLYHLLTTVGLVLQQQRKEWSTITSRGGSTLQLFKMQLLTVLLLSVLSFVLAPLFIRGFMRFLEISGPLAAALDGSTLETVAIPEESFVLAAAAAVLCVVVLSFPAIPAARQSLLSLKQASSRPPTKPAWANYLLDFVLIFVGMALMLRLYWMSSEDLGDDLNDLVAAPSQALKRIADNVGETGGLSDPFNLLAPALILTGVAMLWLRLFPMMMRQISKVVSRRPTLTGPLAVWNVERDPGHYAQLVLLLIGTLALGTGSLALQETRDTGAWEESQHETGGAVRVELSPSQGAESEKVLWERMDGVEDYAEVIRWQASKQGFGPFQVIGVDAEQFGAAFPDYAELVEELQGTEDSMPLPGIELPSDARQLAAQVWSEPFEADEEVVGSREILDVDVILNAHLVDSEGVPFTVQLTSPVDETLIGLDRAVVSRTITLYESPSASADGSALEPGSYDVMPVEIAQGQGQTTTETVDPRYVRICLDAETCGFVRSNEVTVRPAVELERSTSTERWVSLSGEMPTTGRAPYYLWRVSVASEQKTVAGVPISSFEHKFFVDLWQTIDASGSAGTATLIEDFSDQPAMWAQPAETDSRYPAVWRPEGVRTTDFSFSEDEPLAYVCDDELPGDAEAAGRCALRMSYSIAANQEPSITLNVDNIGYVPAIVSERFANKFRGQGQGSATANIPDLRVGDTRFLDGLDLNAGAMELGFEIVDIIDQFPSLDTESSNETERVFIIIPLPAAKHLMNDGLLRQSIQGGFFFDVNQVWLDLPEREPSSSLENDLEAVDGFTGATYAWERYREILFEPLPSAVASLMYAGFWVSLLLSLLDFAFYIIVTAQQRSFTFGVLRSLGWNANNIWRLLLVEQLTLVIPALIIGSLLGAGLAYLILPFFELTGGAALQIPPLQLLALLLSLVLGFGILLVGTSLWLQRMSVNQVLRLGEE